MADDLKTEFQDRLKKINTGMLQAGDRFLPMSHSIIEGDPNLWFITAKGTPMADAAAQGADATYLVCSDGKGLYADITGTLTLSDDAAKLDEVWGVIASSWFEDGKADPDLQLVRYAPKSAEVWVTEGGAIGFLYQIAKAKITDEKPDLGQHGTITLA
ncbi:pyridoxamine 5'-phosphate oxidase family protein [Paracoccus xiamenensis]|uniref:pyridoxamine 5'-phosphate oxidase family protein n=1 Tax=Paracoccus xiamenensis TaxID=2714901 RepID=UPI00140A842C|nr:pyridoxamine 5'-phosphate oxidase family protein [Paracoccus xiamenensis]NHF74780.1 pyridoxamine 5'-phosphate oxidase family protein [Paracoccus xiamenensis]